MPLTIPKDADVTYFLPHTGGEKWWSRFAPREAPLFPAGDAHVNDVVQGSIGDCFVLASIIAVLLCPRGKDFIEDMMVDNGDGTVTARLYDEGTARYLRTKKMWVVQQGPYIGSTAQTTAPASHLWVSMIEVFLSAFVLNGDKPLFVPNDANLRHLNFGHADQVLQVLCGKSGSWHPIPNYLEETKVQGNALLGPEIVFREAMNIPLQKFLSGLDEPSVESAFSEAERKWFKANRDKVAASWQNFLRQRAGKTIRGEDVEGWITANIPDTGGLTVRYSLRKEFKSQLSGRRGTGIYSRRDLEQLEDVKSAFYAGQPVVIATKNHVGRNTTGLGHSGGEEMAKGLIAKHAYAVNNIREGGRVFNRLHYIEVVNPWGRYIRKYGVDASDSRLKALEVDSFQLGNGVFLLALEDYVKRFACMYTVDINLK